MAAPGNQYNPGMISQQNPGPPYSTGTMMSAGQQGMMTGQQVMGVPSQQGMMGGQPTMVGSGQQSMMGSQHVMMGGSQGQQNIMVNQPGMIGSQQNMATPSQQSMLGVQAGMAAANPQGMMGSHQQGMMGVGQQPQIPGQMQGNIHPVPQLTSPTKDVNTITICKKGQECVQDIFQKVTEIFKHLQTKTNPLPNGVTFNSQMHQERRNKLNEQLDQLTLLFKKLRVFYDKVNEVCPDEPIEQMVVPYVGEPFPDNTFSTTDSYRSQMVMEEKREIVEQLLLKNRQLKAIIDQMRTIIWEINTMIVMRNT